MGLGDAERERLRREKQIIRQTFAGLAEELMTTSFGPGETVRKRVDIHGDRGVTLRVTLEAELLLSEAMEDGA